MPGSGKSKHARELAAKTGAFVIEPDMFETVDGVYRYSEKRHGKALATAKSFAKLAMRFHGCDVIVAEVFPRLGDFAELVELARWSGYEVRVVALQISRQQSRERNRHNVRHEDIDRFAGLWEDFPGEAVITQGAQETRETQGECDFCLDQEVVCPHCGALHGTYAGRSGKWKHRCDYCNKVFVAERHAAHEYSTRKLKEGEEER